MIRAVDRLPRRSLRGPQGRASVHMGAHGRRQSTISNKIIIESRFLGSFWAPVCQVLRVAMDGAAEIEVLGAAGEDGAAMPDPLQLDSCRRRNSVKELARVRFCM